MIVDDSGNLSGIVTWSDLRSAQQRPDSAELLVGQIAVKNVVYVQEGDSVAHAAVMMSRLGTRQLPVLAKPMPAPPVGLIRRSDVLRAYEMAIEAQSVRTDRMS